MARACGAVAEAGEIVLVAAPGIAAVDNGLISVEEMQARIDYVNSPARAIMEGFGIAAFDPSVLRKPIVFMEPPRG